MNTFRISSVAPALLGLLLFTMVAPARGALARADEAGGAEEPGEGPYQEHLERIARDTARLAGNLYVTVSWPEDEIEGILAIQPARGEYCWFDRVVEGFDATHTGSLEQHPQIDRAAFFGTLPAEYRVPLTADSPQMLGALKFVAHEAGLDKVVSDAPRAVKFSHSGSFSNGPCTIRYHVCIEVVGLLDSLAAALPSLVDSVLSGAGGSGGSFSGTGSVSVTQWCPGQELPDWSFELSLGLNMSVGSLLDSVRDAIEALI